MSDDEVASAVLAIAALGDPTRKALYEYVVAQGVPVGREEAARAVGVAHHVARFHLDRLHEAGLLRAVYRRPPGRGGPGAGHPTKLYSQAPGEFAVSIPSRRYDLAGLVFSQAVARALDGTPIDEALQAVAGQAGRGLSAPSEPQEDDGEGPDGPLAAAISTLDACGFEPRAVADGYVLGNCPFRSLAQAEPEVVCKMNLALVRGLLDEAGVPAVTARLDPAEDRCCVTIGA